VNTADDDLLIAAIREKRCLTGLYDGGVRHFAPHALGTTSDGSPAVFVFQYAGETTKGLPIGGQWRCFHLDRLSHRRINEHRWRSRSNYSLKRQTCLATVTAGVATCA
jgi:hypothetical protein